MIHLTTTGWIIVSLYVLVGAVVVVCMCCDTEEGIIGRLMEFLTEELPEVGKHLGCAPTRTDSCARTRAHIHALALARAHPTHRPTHSPTHPTVAYDGAIFASRTYTQHLGRGLKMCVGTGAHDVIVGAFDGGWTWLCYKRNPVFQVKLPTSAHCTVAPLVSSMHAHTLSCTPHARMFARIHVIRH